jgi:transposase
MIEETLAPGAIVSEVARRHGITPQQLFGWRRQARQSAAISGNTDAPLFVPVVVEAPLPERTRVGEGAIGRARPTGTPGSSRSRLTA